ncbi:hypothetical protein CEXT_306061 [Caerostris extrusa]|uniref:Uncharacterized protein n=1 Tax=Caerostris extrusa TaxID=172846 RepID=A0AAV4V231_CAEEX|nr:hypothetical protein CEXT_306061 [Caerostris extrusa]
MTNLLGLSEDSSPQRGPMVVHSNANSQKGNGAGFISGFPIRIQLEKSSEKRRNQCISLPNHFVHHYCKDVNGNYCML